VNKLAQQLTVGVGPSVGESKMTRESKMSRAKLVRKSRIFSEKSRFFGIKKTYNSAHFKVI
jgi:hypothetical protein